MSDLRVLLVAGNWTEDGGRSSNYMTSVANSFESKLGHPIQAFNGGDVDDLPSILETHVPESDLVFWSPNIPYSSGDKRRINPKDYDHRVTLVTLKRNDGQLDFDDVMSISIALRADLSCEVRRNAEGRYEMRVYDILGNLWSDFTTNTARSVATIVSRGSALKSLRYARFRGDRGNLPSAGLPESDLSDVVDAYRDFGNRLVDVVRPSSQVRRHLGEASVRVPGTGRGVASVASERNVRLADPLSLVPTVATDRGLTYYGDRKPHLNAAVFGRLMADLPDLECVFSSQCYVKGARFTDRILPKGCLQVVGEVEKALERDGGTLSPVNVLGQGSLILGRDLDEVRACFDLLERRELPEPIGVEFDVIQLDDGVETFDSILDGRKLVPGELLEIQFADGSAGTYEIMISSYRDDCDRQHREAYVTLNVKGVPVDFPVTGMLARRI